MCSGSTGATGRYGSSSILATMNHGPSSFNACRSIESNSSSSATVKDFSIPLDLATISKSVPNAVWLF